MTEHVHSGQCHCGAVRAALHTAKPAGEIEVRACQCGFCTRQGAMTISDPQGRAEISAAPDGLSRYQFETRTGTSLICRTCGVYVGVVLQDGGQTWSVLNVRGLAIPAFLGRTPTPMHYSRETAAERIARRKAKWTPTRLMEAKA